MSTEEPSKSTMVLALSLIPKLGGPNKDVRSWASQISSWSELYKVKNDKELFYWSKMATQSDVAELMDSFIVTDSEGEKVFPNLEEIKKNLLKESGQDYDQGDLLAEIKSAAIQKNESIIEFNSRYKKMYRKLDEDKKKSVTVYDYKKAIEKRPEAWSGVQLAGDIPLEEAYSKAEQYDKLSSQSSKLNWIRRNNNNNSNNYNNYPIYPLNVGWNNNNQTPNMENLYDPNYYNSNRNNMNNRNNIITEYYNKH